CHPRLLHSTASSLTPPPSLFSFTPPPPTQPSPLSLHDALPISRAASSTTSVSRRLRADSLRIRSAIFRNATCVSQARGLSERWRSEEHTSELQSPYDLVCRLLLEKKKKKHISHSLNNIYIYLCR